VLISLDRQERGRGEISAIQEVERDYGCKVISIVTLKDLIAIWKRSRRWLNTSAVRAYREAYGVLLPGEIPERPDNAAGHPLLQLCGDQRPAGVKIIRRTIFKLAAHKARQHPFAKCQQLAGQQRFIDGVAFAFAHFLSRIT
jgi:hypothetical protein